LHENWRVIARYDPELAHTQKFVAEALKDGRFTESFLARAAVPVPSPAKAVRLSQHAQAQMASSWMLDRQENWPKDRPSPSAAEDWRDAQFEIPGVARKRIEDARPVEWKITRGKKPNFPNS
jgi:hypothetical protein